MECREKADIQRVGTQQQRYCEGCADHAAQTRRYCRHAWCGRTEILEHAVEHGGKLRFTLTCRCIDPESLKHEDQPKYEVECGVEGYGGSRLM